MPHGLLHLEAALHAVGHTCTIMDMNHPATVWNPDTLNGFDLVGFSVMTTQLPSAVTMAETINPKIPVVWGGVHALLDPRSLLRRFPQHFLVRGDGEQPLVDLITHLEGRQPETWLATRPGICFNRTEPVINSPWFAPDLDALPDIDYTRLPHLESYLSTGVYFVQGPVRQLQILTARGCHWNCAFCINPLLARQGGKYRRKSMAKIRRETERFIDQYDLDFVFPRDEDFFLNQDLLQDWESYAVEKGFLWGANCRFNYFRNHLLNGNRLRQLVDHGLCQIGMSIETGDEQVRNDILRKQVTDRDIYSALAIIAENAGKRLTVNTSFIVDFPGDTPSSRTRIIPFMDRLSRSLNVYFSGPQAYRSYPGSDLWETSAAHPQGELDYYLRQIQIDGAMTTDRHSDSWFYTRLLPKYFNTRFRLYMLQRNGRKRALHLTASGISTFSSPLVRAAVSIFFLPIRLRLAFNLWRAFIEPSLLQIIAGFWACLSRRPISRESDVG